METGEEFRKELCKKRIEQACESPRACGAENMFASKDDMQTYLCNRRDLLSRVSACKLPERMDNPERKKDDTKCFSDLSKDVLNREAKCHEVVQKHCPDAQARAS